MSVGRDRSMSVESWLASLATPGRPDEYEAKRLLAAWGIAVPAGVRLLPHEPLPALDSSTRVVKVCSPGVAHKTEARGVALGVAPAALAATIADFRVRFPGQPLLIEEEVRGVGAEFIVGGLVDATFGRAVMVGSGGILTELMEDVAFRLAPCPQMEARRMLEELQVAPLFRGYRGLDLDADGLAEVIHRVGEIICALGDRCTALDVNPLVYTGEQWTALDAHLALPNQGSDPSSA